MSSFAPFHISLMKDMAVVEQAVTINSLDSLLKAITSHSWSPATFRNDYRLIENAESISLMVLDIDSGCTLEQAAKDFADYQFVIATTRSHQKEKAGKTVDRFRVILWLDEPIKDDPTFKATWLALEAKFPYIDPACKDISRFFYPCKAIYKINMDETGLGGVEIVKPSPADPVNKQSGAEDTESFPEGTRNHNLFKVASALKRYGCTLDALEMALHSVNEVRCIPPLPDTDVMRIARQADKYQIEPSTPRYEQEEDIDQERSAQAAPTALDIVDQTFEYLADDDKARGMQTGLEELSTLLGGGFRKGELTVLTALEKTGKNAFWEFLQLNLLKQGIPQGYASQEISPRKGAVATYASIILGKNLWLQPPTEAEQELVKDQLKSFPIYFTANTGSLSWEQTEAWMDNLLVKGVSNFWFDHLHYMLDDTDYVNAANRLKLLRLYADKNDVHINVIVQPTDIGQARRVTKSNIKGGGQLRQHLDTMLTFNRVDPAANISILKRELGRSNAISGACDHVYIQYDADKLTFKVLPDYEEPEDEGFDEPMSSYPGGYANRQANGTASRAAGQQVSRRAVRRH